jgi:hypothetical protein
MPETKASLKILFVAAVCDPKSKLRRSQSAATVEVLKGIFLLPSGAQQLGCVARFDLKNHEL